MNWFRFLRRDASAPTSSPVSRRRFFAGAGAVAGSVLLTQPAWAGAQGPDLGIEAGTLGDAQGRPVGHAPMGIEPFIGEIMMFGGNFAPRGWAMCNGQILPIAQYTALFSLLGTTYGGNGQTTFALPDLRGRLPMHFGQGPGLSSRTLGEQSGTETHTLIATEIPAHAHTLPEVQVRGTGTQTVGAAAGGDRGTEATSAAGGSQPHNNMPPYLAINFCIALEGIFPSRN